MLCVLVSHIQSQFIMKTYKAAYFSFLPNLDLPLPTIF